MEKTPYRFGRKIALVAGVVVVIGAILYGISGKKAADIPMFTYTDSEVRFSIDLPTGWTVREKENSTQASSTWFHNASSTDAAGVTVAVERFVRTPEMDKTIRMFGVGPFTQGLVESLWVDLELTILKNEAVMIGDEKFVHILSTYVGKDSKREVTQHMYFTFTPDHYYRIGVDAYTDVWEKNKDMILKSVETFKVLP